MHSTQERKLTPMRAFILSLIVLLVGSMLNPAAMAQPGPNPVLNSWDLGTPAGSGTGNWNVGANWTGTPAVGPDPAIPDVVPDVSREDAAIINGGGTAQLNSAASFNVGSIVLGQGAAANQSGTLEIQSGGSINVVDDPTFAADGSVRVGQNAGGGFLQQTETVNPNAGTGTLRILPGGTLNSVSVNIYGGANSLMVVGSTSPGTATVNTGRVVVGRTLRVIGPNVNFNSSGAGAGINFESTGILIPEITGATHSILKSTGPVYLGGTLQADFNGVTPTLGQSWDIIDAPSIERNFTSVLPDAAVPLGTAQRLAVRTVAGGTGRLVQLFVQQMPVLTVNRDTGAVAITNPGSAGFPIDGYTIQSNLGMNLASWQSLEDNPGVAGTGWFEANPTANRLSEVRSGSTSNFAAGGSWPMGNIYNPVPTQFGQNLDDFVFQYDDPVTQATVNGVINYTGVGVINNLALYADPATGNVKIRNTSPFTVQIDGYTISSAGGSLNSNPALWTSLQDQPGVAPNWFEGDLTDNRVSEVMSQGTTTLTANGVTTFDLGGLFKTAGAQDLVFQFLLAGNSQPNTGVVRYEPAPGGDIPGDFNHDGRVNAADYVVWRKTDGSQAGYNSWRMNFGRTSGSGSALAGGAVPEPASFVLLAGGLFILAIARRF
jgi:hypothetical protein